MRRNFLWATLVILAALIQTTWLDVITVRGVQPDLVLLLVVYFAILDGEERAMWTGALGGVFSDVATSTRLGHHVVCFVIVGYVLGQISHRLIKEHPIVKAVLVVASALAYGVLYNFVSNLIDPEHRAFSAIANETIPGAFYTAVFAPIMFFVLSRFFVRKHLSQGGFA